ncbi:MAG: EamA family transporter, partial [Pseudomonadota bacterium]
MELAWIWIPISVFAALMQAVRTAAQKTLNQSMSTMGTTYVRSLFGMPTLIVFLGAAMLYTGHGIPKYNPAFLLHTAVAALTQVLATALLIHMFRLKNFAVGTMLTKTDIIMTALIGTALFSEQLTPLGWVALVVVVCGTILMLVGRMGTAAFRASGETLSGLLAGRPTRVAL